MWFCLAAKLFQPVCEVCTGNIGTIPTLNTIELVSVPLLKLCDKTLQKGYRTKKEMQKMGEVPGPGSYNGGDLSTVAGSAVAKAVGVPAGGISKQGLNTISSAGTGAFFR